MIYVKDEECFNLLESWLVSVLENHNPLSFLPNGPFLYKLFMEIRQILIFLKF